MIAKTEANSSTSSNLSSSFKAKLQAASSRPVLCHLNADTSWLLSLAYPTSASARPPPGRTRFNILIDPWFTGSQSDVAGWFSTQYHAIESSVQSISSLNAILAEAESSLDTVKDTDTDTDTKPSSGTNPSPPFHIDAVIISHEFTDHCHKATLLELPTTVPIFSTTKAIELIKSWNHFTTIINIPSLTKSTDWRTTSHPSLPPWLGISRLITEGNSLYYHSAIIICIAQASSPSCTSDCDDSAEAVIYTPHGLHAPSFTPLLTLTPPISTLALLHGLHDVSITLTKQLNLGAHNALQAQQLLKPRYWVGTHDEVKTGKGLIGLMLRRKEWTLEDAVRENQRKRKKGTLGKKDGKVDGGAGGNGAEGLEEDEKIPFVTCGNGDSLILEQR